MPVVVVAVPDAEYQRWIAEQHATAGAATAETK